MRGNDFLDKMELVDPAFVEEADKKPTHKKRRWINLSAVAACLCLLIMAIPFLMQTLETPQINFGNDTMDGPPYLTVGNTRFLISSHLPVTEELPAGFEEAGQANVGGFENCSYYLNPNVPEWVYVYHEVRTDGTVDATGTLTSTTPHDAYVRYVDERLRDKNLVYYNDEYYISMWSANCFGENPDVSEAYYNKMETQYGIRVEGSAPEGFVLAGTAEFTGDDTIPIGNLASNKESAEVYYSPDAPDIVLVATHWFTATAEENGETRHDGYDVYILYDCPLRKGQ